MYATLRNWIRSYGPGHLRKRFTPKPLYSFRIPPSDTPYDLSTLETGHCLARLRRQYRSLFDPIQIRCIQVLDYQTILATIFLALLAGMAINTVLLKRSDSSLVILSYGILGITIGQAFVALDAPATFSIAKIDILYAIVGFLLTHYGIQVALTREYRPWRLFQYPATFLIGLNAAHEATLTKKPSDLWLLVEDHKLWSDWGRSDEGAETRKSVLIEPTRSTPDHDIAVSSGFSDSGKHLAFEVTRRWFTYKEVIKVSPEGAGSRFRIDVQVDPTTELAGLGLITIAPLLKLIWRVSFERRTRELEHLSHATSIPRLEPEGGFRPDSEDYDLPEAHRELTG